jgi:predicted transcriptional regulator
MSGAPQRRHDLYGFEEIEPDKRRRTSDDDVAHYEIKQMWQRSHEIVNLAAQGLSNVDIAKFLGITPQTVSHTLNSPLGREKLSKLREARDDDAKKTQAKIKELTDRALAIYYQILDDETGEVSQMQKAKVADTVVLELSGHRAATKVDTRHTSIQLTPEELKGFSERGKQFIDVTHKDREKDA